MHKLYNLYKSANGYESDFIRYLYVFSFPILLLYTYLNIRNGADSAALLDVFSLLMLSLSLYLFKRGRDDTFAKNMILSSLFFLHLSSLLYGIYANSSFFLFFLFPLVALFICSKKTALAWIALLMSTIMISVVLIDYAILNVNYDPQILFTLLVALLVETFIIDYSHEVMLRYKEGLEQFNNSLLTTNTLIDKYFIIIRTDLEGKITQVNDTYIRLSKHRRETLMGAGFMELCKQESEDCLSPEFFEAASKEKTLDTLIECRKRDGSYYWADTHIVMEYDEYDHQMGFLIFQQDVTQHIKLQKVSTTDTLTQVDNRMRFDEVSRERLEYFNRYARVSSLILCDIDDFKLINDKYGHLVGDEVLKTLAKLLKDHIREGDTLARWGGEEFAILLPETDIARAVVTAEKICQIVHAYDFDLPEDVTVSFGVAMTKETDTQVSWFKRADKALYQAKESGKNRVYSF